MLDEVLDEALASTRGFRFGWHYVARQLGLRVWRAENAVVVDVVGSIAFPRGQGDLTGWRRVLRLIQRHRPQRPIDGVILAIPAPLLLDSQPALRDYGVMVRDRLAQIHGHFGFILPVYVIVTQCDRLRGFEAFALSLPESLRDTMLGWSNDRTPDAVRDALAGDLSALDRLRFNREWIAEDMASLEGSLSAAQAGLLASSGSTDHAASLMFFSGELERLAAPLAEVLDEALRANQYYGSSLFRGFYLCGSTAPLGGGTAFAGHLLHRKVFREKGLAIPRPEVAVSRLRGRLAAQAVCAVLAVGLAIGTAWSYGRLREAWPAYSRVLTTGAALTGDQPGTSLQEHMVKRRAFLEQALEIKRGRIAEAGTRIFMPASIPTERQLSTVVRGVFADLLGYLRAGLEDKWQEWHRSATFGPGDRLGPLGPDLKETAPHKAVDRFADDYQRFVENYERYERLGRSEGAGDLAAAGGMLEYLTGVGLSATTLAPSLARSVREVRTATIDCRLFVDPRTQASLVAMRASDLLMQFRTVSFDDVEGDDVRWRNVVAGASRFKAGWISITEATADDRTLENLIDDAAKLAEAVKAWAAFRGPSRTLAIPAFGKPPFKQRPPSEGFCDALRPDLSAEMKAVDALKDQLTVRLLDDEVPPFGRLLDEGESGLAFTTGVAAFKAGLDDLRRQGFWQQLPADLAVALPANPAWRKEDIDAAQKIADAFAAYRGGAFRNLDDSYRVNVLDVIETAVAQLVSATLASSAGAGPARPTRPEDLTRLRCAAREHGSIDAMAEPRSRSRDGDPRQPHPSGERGAGGHRSRGLSRIFFSRSRNTPMTSAGIFAAWRELEGAAPAAEAAKRWSAIVDEQREALRMLANQARPLVDYLSSGPSAERVRRWAAIVADVADYDQKRPGNAVNALDAVMREGIPATAPDRSCGPVGSSGEPRGNGFFDAVRNDLVAEGLRQCVEVRYASIAAEFNRLLSTRFPFSRPVDAAQEATREQVAQFVRVYQTQGGRFLGPLLTAAFVPGGCVGLREKPRQGVCAPELRRAASGRQPPIDGARSRARRRPGISRRSGRGQRRQPAWRMADRHRAPDAPRTRAGEAGDVDVRRPGQPDGAVRPGLAESTGFERVRRGGHCRGRPCHRGGSNRSLGLRRKLGVVPPAPGRARRRRRALFINRPAAHRARIPDPGRARHDTAVARRPGSGIAVQGLHADHRISKGQAVPDRR